MKYIVSIDNSFVWIQLVTVDAWNLPFDENVAAEKLWKLLSKLQVRQNAVGRTAIAK